MNTLQVVRWVCGVANAKTNARVKTIPRAIRSTGIARASAAGSANTARKDVPGARTAKIAPNSAVASTENAIIHPASANVIAAIPVHCKLELTYQIVTIFTYQFELKDVRTAVQSAHTGNTASQSVRVKMVARAIRSLAAATVKMAGRDKCAPIGASLVFGVSTVRKSAIASMALLVITLTALVNVCPDSLEIAYGFCV